MECLARVIDGSCEAGVVHVKSEDGSIDTSSTREKITWANKSQKIDVALIQAQKHFKLANVRLLAPSKNRFSYIMNSFKSLLVNKDSIKYIYVPIPVVVNEIKTHKP